MTNDAERVSDIKTAINIEFQRLYEEGVRSGKHGHYETMFGAMHQAYAPLIEAQSKALAEARKALKVTAHFAKEYNGYYNAGQLMVHGISLNDALASAAVILTPTPENPNG